MLYFLHTGQCQDVTQHPEISWRYVSQSAEMNCSHNKDISHTQMYWFRQRPGETMTLVVYTVVGGQPDYGGVPQTKYSAIKENTESGALTVKDLQLEDSAVYFCAVSKHSDVTSMTYFGGGTKLTVLVKVLPPSTKECRNQKDGPRKKTIVCVASGFYPDHVSVKWKIDGIKATSGVATDNAALREGRYYRITSRLKVSGEDWFTLYKNFTCIVEFFDGTATIPYEDTCLVPCLISTKYTGCFLFMSLNWM
uniref:Ig-like domain-containing protein n=1 Tax=Sander lucioperca TaxID=283035 RepID=A0A8C9WU35_SANLU